MVVCEIANDSVDLRIQFSPQGSQGLLVQSRGPCEGGALTDSPHVGPAGLRQVS